MDADFWHQRWEANKIAFHAREANPLLVAHIGELSLLRNDRVFVPLCGKTLDIGWMLSRGYRVVGAELSVLAVEQLFSELGTEARITDVGKMKCYSAKDIDIFVGDIFELTSGRLGPVDAVFDRAAYVALPEEMRVRYADHLTNITDKAPQLLITFEYDHKLLEGPPFSIPGAEVQRRYGRSYDVSALAVVDVVGGLKGIAATESAWLLTPIE